MVRWGRSTVIFKQNNKIEWNVGTSVCPLTLSRLHLGSLFARPTAVGHSSVQTTWRTRGWLGWSALRTSHFISLHFLQAGTAADEARQDGTWGETSCRAGFRWSRSINVRSTGKEGPASHSQPCPSAVPRGCAIGRMRASPGAASAARQGQERLVAKSCYVKSTV